MWRYKHLALRNAYMYYTWLTAHEGTCTCKIKINCEQVVGMHFLVFNHDLRTELQYSQCLCVNSDSQP